MICFREKGWCAWRFKYGLWSKICQGDEETFTAGENINAASKIRNNYVATQAFILPIILDFSLLLLLKLSLLILYASFLVLVLCFFFDSFLSNVIALPTIAIAIRLPLLFAIAVAIVGRAITIWEAIQKRSHEPIYKTYTNIVAKLEER